MPFSIHLGDDHFALLDSADYEELADFRWHWRPVRNSKEVQAARYVTVDGKRRLSYLHNEVMKPPEGHQVVFPSGNRLDCRFWNLLVVPNDEAYLYKPKTPKPEQVKGVRYCKREKSWIAHLQRGGVRWLVGKFPFRSDAILARDDAIEEYERTGKMPSSLALVCQKGYKAQRSTEEQGHQS